MNTPYCMITQCRDYGPDQVRQQIQAHLEQIPDLPQRIRPGDRVLIKPNLIAPKGIEQPTQTHPCIIIETARLLKEYGARPIVGDSPAWGSARQCAQALGLTRPLEHLDVPLITLNQGRLMKIGQPARRVLISKEALEADVVINLPKFKAHQQLTATLAVKNMFGCVVGKQKPYWHYAQGRSLEHFGRFLWDICQIVNPAFTLIDAITAMQGKGPINGNPYPMGLLISSVDPAACERAAVYLLGQPPERFPVISALPPSPLPEQFQWPGWTPEPGIYPDFSIPPQIPLQFSLTRVIKSAIQGIITRTMPQ